MSPWSASFSTHLHASAPACATLRAEAGSSLAILARGHCGKVAPGGLTPQANTGRVDAVQQSSRSNEANSLLHARNSITPTRCVGNCSIFDARDNKKPDSATYVRGPSPRGFIAYQNVGALNAPFGTAHDSHFWT